MGLFLLLIALLILCWLLSIKITKQNIADYYGISKKTLDKWVRVIPNKICYQTYKEARKLSAWMVLQIVKTFGFVEDQKPLNKNTILVLCETNYRTARENISERYCGISLEMYVSMNIFPPVISSRLIHHLGI